MPASANYYGQNFSEFNVPGNSTGLVLIPAQITEAGAPLLIRIVSGFIFSNGTTVTFDSGTTLTPISPVMTFNNGGGIPFDYNPAGWFQTLGGQALCVTTGPGPNVAIQVNWIVAPAVAGPQPPPLLLTNIVITSGSNPSIAGNHTFTAAIVPQSFNYTLPTGTVAFVVDGAIQPAVAINSNGLAQATINIPATGNHTITAIYSGDSLYAPNTTAPTYTQTVNSSWTAPFQPQGINVVTTYGLKNDGVSDNTEAMNIMFAGLANGKLLYFPAGTYIVSGQITVVPSAIGMIGDVVYSPTSPLGAPASIIMEGIGSGSGSGSSGSGSSAPLPGITMVLFNNENNTAGVIAQVRNMQFIAGPLSTAMSLYSANPGSGPSSEPGTALINCVFTGFAGLVAIGNYDTSIRNCAFIGYGSAIITAAQYIAGTMPGFDQAGVVSIGYNPYQMTMAACSDCTFSGWTEGIRIGGSSQAAIRCTFTNNGIGIRAGCNPMGLNYGGGGAAPSCTFTGNDVALYCQDGAMGLIGSTITGNSSSPSGGSIIGVFYGTVGCTLQQNMTINGTYSQVGLYLKAGEPSYDVFNQCSIVSQFVPAGLTQVSFSNTTLPYVPPIIDDITASLVVPGAWNVVNVVTAGVPLFPTDCTAALQALIAASPSGTLFYFPGTFAVQRGAVFDFSHLSSWAMMGNGIGSSAFIPSGGSGNTVFKADYGPSGTGTFQISGIYFDGQQLYFRNAVLSAIQDCVIGVSNVTTCEWVNPFACCMRNVQHTGTNTIGILGSNVMGFTLENFSTYGGGNAAVQVTGTNFGMVASHIEETQIGVNLGVDPNSNSVLLQNSYINGLTSESTGTTVNANYVNNFIYYQGLADVYNKPPVLTAPYYVHLINCQNSTWASIAGTGTASIAYVAIEAASANNTFYCCQLNDNSNLYPRYIDNDATTFIALYEPP
jgi:hypothetical protein